MTEREGHGEMGAYTGSKSNTTHGPEVHYKDPGSSVPQEG